MVKVRVLVADGEVLFREGICVLLKSCKSIEVAGEATNRKETFKKVRGLTPDVVLMNTTLLVRNGTKVINHIRKENGDTKVLLLIQYQDKNYILNNLRVGADGYITKQASATELVRAIHTVHNNGCFLSPSVTKLVCEYLRVRLNQDMLSTI